MENIKDEHIPIICKMVSQNTSVKQLTLGSRELKEESWQDLFRSMKYNTSITHCFFTENVEKCKYQPLK